MDPRSEQSEDVPTLLPRRPTPHDRPRSGRKVPDAGPEHDPAGSAVAGRRRSGRNAQGVAGRAPPSEVRRHQRRTCRHSTKDCTPNWPMSTTLEPESVARQALGALGRRSNADPGYRHKVLHATRGNHCTITPRDTQSTTHITTGGGLRVASATQGRRWSPRSHSAWSGVPVIPFAGFVAVGSPPVLPRRGVLGCSGAGACPRRSARRAS